MPTHSCTRMHTPGAHSCTRCAFVYTHISAYMHGRETQRQVLLLECGSDRSRVTIPLHQYSDRSDDVTSTVRRLASRARCVPAVSGMPFSCRALLAISLWLPTPSIIHLCCVNTSLSFHPFLPLAPAPLFPSRLHLRKQRPRARGASYACAPMPRHTRARTMFSLQTKFLLPRQLRLSPQGSFACRPVPHPTPQTQEQTLNLQPSTPAVLEPALARLSTGTTWNRTILSLFQPGMLGLNPKP